MSDFVPAWTREEQEAFHATMREAGKRAGIAYEEEIMRRVCAPSARAIIPTPPRVASVAPFLVAVGDYTAARFRVIFEECGPTHDVAIYRTPLGRNEPLTLMGAAVSQDKGYALMGAMSQALDRLIARAHPEECSVCLRPCAEGLVDGEPMCDLCIRARMGK